MTENQPRVDLIKKALEDLIATAKKRAENNADLDIRQQASQQNIIELKSHKISHRKDDNAPLRDDKLPEPLHEKTGTDRASDQVNAQGPKVTPFDPEHEETEARIIQAAQALIFSSPSPVSKKQLSKVLGTTHDWDQILEAMTNQFSSCGFELVERSTGFIFQTKKEFGSLLASRSTETKTLSNAAIEVLAIIAYHQPVSRSEIEAVRGVSVGKEILERLMEVGWVQYGARRQSPGRPITYQTTSQFLDHFNLKDRRDLPGLRELDDAGLLSVTCSEELRDLLPSIDNSSDETALEITDSPEFIQDFVERN